MSGTADLRRSILNVQESSQHLRRACWMDSAISTQTVQNEPGGKPDTGRGKWRRLLRIIIVVRMLCLNQVYPMETHAYTAWSLPPTLAYEAEIKQ